jgi:hypothetical protein
MAPAQFNKAAEIGDWQLPGSILREAHLLSHLYRILLLSP